MLLIPPKSRALSELTRRKLEYSKADSIHSMGRRPTLQAYQQVFASLTTTSSPQTSWICGPCVAKIDSRQQSRKLSGTWSSWQQATIQVGDEKQVPGYEGWAAGRRLRDQEVAAAQAQAEDAIELDPEVLHTQAERVARGAARKQAATIKYLRDLASQQVQGPSLGRKKVAQGSSRNADQLASSLSIASNAPLVESRRLALIDALQQRSLDNVAQLLSDAVDNHTFFISIPATTWSQILELLSSKHVSAPLHKLHRSFNSARLKSVQVSYSRSVKAFMDNIINVIRMRRDHGLAMTLADYRILLGHVAVRGDARLGRVLWKEMHRDEIRPDVTCFSAYMSVIVWDEESRIAWGSRMKRASTEGTASRTHVTLLQPGSSDEVKSLMDQMRNERIVPTTDCYCTYMIALARDGYMNEVEDVLSQVFHVDVDSIMVGQTDELKSMSSRPNIQHNNRLLVTIAETFGEANRIPTALSIIDYISTTYNVSVSNGVWYKLTQWTGIQARIKPSKRPSIDGQQQMQLQSVRALGDLLVAPPYNAKPSISTRDIISRSAGSGTGPRFTHLLYQMEVARQEYIVLVGRFRRQHARYTSMSRQRHMSKQLGQMNLRITRHRLGNLEVKKKMAHVTLHRLARKIISLKGNGYVSGPGAVETNQWRLVGLPNFILRWNGFLPDTLRYRIKSGLVEMQFRTKEDRAKQAARKSAARQRTTFQWLDISGLKQPWMSNELRRAGKNRLRDVPRVVPANDIMRSQHEVTMKSQEIFDQSYGS